MQLMPTNVLPSYSLADIETPRIYISISESRYPDESYISPPTSIIHLHPSEISQTFTVSEIQRTNFQFHTEAFAPMHLNETMELNLTETYVPQVFKTEVYHVSPSSPTVMSSMHSEEVSPTFLEDVNMNSFYTHGAYKSWNKIEEYEIEVSKTSFEARTGVNFSIASITTLPILNTGISIVLLNNYLQIEF